MFVLSLILTLMTHAPLGHASAIPLGDEDWEPPEASVVAPPAEPTPNIAKRAKPRWKASHLETPARSAGRKALPLMNVPLPPRRPVARARINPRKTSAQSPATSLEPPRSAAPSPAPAPRAAAAPRAESIAPTGPTSRGLKPKPVPASPLAKAEPPPPKLKETTPPKTTAKPVGTCSGRTAEIKELIAQSINTNIFNITWAEDTPVRGSSGRFAVLDKHGDAQIEMINGDGESVGISPARVCLITGADGKKALRVSLQMASLNLGYFQGSVLRGMLQKKFGSDKELPLIVSAASPGKIHISDGIDQSLIKSQFTNVGARQ